jgi:ATP/maltotriose-dependent transcriptional regulator MalT
VLALRGDDPGGADVATRAVVAVTKLTIPRSRRPLMARPELSARLDADYRLALVSAPAGYGKTAVLASWAADHPDEVAWLSCDPSDAEPSRFVCGLLSAISARWPGVADDALALMEWAGADTYDTAVAAANGLAALDAPGVIVVDDLHLAAPDPAMLAAFLDALPDTFRFVAGTRSDPPLSLARLRLRGELVELRGDDLRFSAAEMSAFFALHDVPLARGELHRLHELTEGWAAGAQLAAITLQRGVGRDDFLDAFASTDRAVGDFLLSEVLASLPPDLVDFLVETSVLDAFDAGLCVDVTGREEAPVLLDRVLAANLFVVPLDDQARWFRYHHLFGAFLRARLASLGSARVRAAHDRACGVLEDRRDVEGALTHAMAMGDVERAGRILRAALRRSMSMSEGAEVAARALRLWLHEFGATFVETDPAGVVEFLIGLITLDGADDAPSWLDRVRRAHPHADGELAALIEGAWSEHHQHRGQPREAIRHLHRAREFVGGRPPSHGLMSLLHAAAAGAHVQAGDLDAAGAVVEQALAHPTGGRVADDVRVPGIAAFVAATAGELSRADQLAARTRTAADQLGLGDHDPGRIFAGVALVELHLERHEHEAAGRILDEVTRASDASHRLTLQSLVTLQNARLARVLGDASGADALLAKARRLYAEPDAAVRHVLGLEAVEQALRFDPSTAAPLLADLDRDRVETGVLHVRLALLAHDDRAATLLLADLPPATTRRLRAERSVLCALSVLERDVEAANGHARDALAAGQPERLIRTIVEPGPGVAKLLLSFTPDRGQDRYVEDLLATARHVVAPVRAAMAPTLVEPLSSREVTVLRYLCSRLTYREIAAALFVSLNTLKTHVKSVYRKLGVASRADAVEAGRRSGVI